MLPSTPVTCQSYLLVMVLQLCPGPFHCPDLHCVPGPWLVITGGPIAHPRVHVWLPLSRICLYRPSFETLKLTSDKHITWKTSFLLALALAKGVNELHGLSFCVRHSRGWRSCTFSFLSDFIAKTQNPSVSDPHCDEFSVPSLDDFVDGDRDELLLCPIRALRKYLSWKKQYCPGIESLFVSTGVRKKRCLATPFLSGCSLSFHLHISWSPRRTVVSYGSGLMKSRRLLLPFCSGGTALSSGNEGGTSSAS